MQLSEASSLIQHPIKKGEGAWADLGCGRGLFTLALSQLLEKGSIIYAVDKNKTDLDVVQVNDGIKLNKIELDFVQDFLPFTHLSGILMANAFHFVQDKQSFIHKVLNCLGKNGYLIMVEYDRDTANPWVPFPVSFKSLELFFDPFGYTANKLKEIPSKFQGNIYSVIISKKLTNTK